MTLKGKYQKFHHRGSGGWRCSTLTCRNYLCVQGLIIVPNRGLLSILWGRNDRRGVINWILSKPLVSAFQRPERHGSMSVHLKQALRGVYGRCVQTRCWREGRCSSQAVKWPWMWRWGTWLLNVQLCLKRLESMRWQRACQMQGSTVQVFHFYLKLKIDVCEP